MDDHVNKNYISILVDGCHKLGINLDKEQKDQFIIYYELLIERNRVINLTTITEFKDVIIKHFLDSLLIVKVFDICSAQKNNYKVIDIGTGAGFPGIPIKIVYPYLDITLVDSINKRVLFLDEIIYALHLKYITTVHERAEILGRDISFRERYDLVLSRAVAKLSTLSELCIPFAKIGGKFVAYKSSNVDFEYRQAINAIKALGGMCDGPISFNVPMTDIVRTFVCISKVDKTPAIFPRKAGIPRRNPLT